jgi:hypothetical protein
MKGALLFVAGILLAGCSRSNNLVLGRVEAEVGGHTVVVTDCYRTDVPPPQHVEAAVYRFTPCRDADVWIRNGELEVNGKRYGRLSPADSVLVDHGHVSINKGGSSLFRIELEVDGRLFARIERTQGFGAAAGPLVFRPEFIIRVRAQPAE